MSPDGPLWRPPLERVASANLTRFRERVAAQVLASGLSSGSTGPAFGGVVADLHPWSVREPAAFWQEVWNFCGVVASQPPARVVDDPERLPGARWLEGARLRGTLVQHPKEHVLHCDLKAGAP